MNKLEMKMAEDQPKVRQMYAQKGTGLIYEVQPFDTFVLIRMATPGFESMIRKLSLGQFEDEFEECDVNPEVIRQYLRGERWETPLTILK